MTKFTIFFRVLWVFVIAFIIFVWNVSSIKNIDNSTNDVSSILYEKEKKIIISNEIDIFLVENYTALLVSSIFLLLLMTAITIIRVLQSRNEWRELIDEGDIEVMESLSYRKKIEKEINDEL
tara:strand:- start:505 stop:870 length:366 start_codon:yes stop_codon:yes gene_type:complete